MTPRNKYDGRQVMGSNDKERRRKGSGNIEGQRYRSCRRFGCFFHYTYIIRLSEIP